MYGCVQSAIGPLSSEGEAGVWQAAQDNPPRCGFEVSLNVPLGAFTVM